MKHRSSEPGASTAPVSQLSAPLGRTLIFWLPKTKAIRFSPKTSRRMPSTRTYQSVVVSTSRQLRTTWSMRSTANAMATRYCGKKKSGPAFQRPHSSTQRGDGLGRVLLFDGACPGAEELTHRVTRLLFLTRRDGELGRPDHGALVWSALADPELTAKVVDRQFRRCHLVSVEPLRGIALRQPLDPSQAVLGFQRPRRAGLFALPFRNLHHRMPSRDALNPTQPPPHRSGAAMDVGEHLNLWHAHRIPAETVHHPWQDDGHVPVAARRRQHVVSLVFRCALVDQGTRRAARQRRARLP